MQASKNCFDLIKQYEGLVLHAYVDPGTGNLPITIGYGSTMRKDGSKFKLGDTITQAEAEDLLEWEVNKKAQLILAMLPKTTINQNQLDALTSFAYNVGIGNLSSSTLLKKVKVNPADSSIPSEFSRWNKAGGKILQGLTKRRIAEYTLYKA